MLKTAWNFQAALNQASNSQQPNLLTDLDSAFHELFKNVIKMLSFDWDGALATKILISAIDFSNKIAPRIGVSV